MAHFLRAVSLTMAAVLAMASARGETVLPEGEGKQLTMRVCGGCHGMDVVTRRRLPKAVWSSVVDKMAAAGANATDYEFDVITGYLVKNFGEQQASSDGGMTPAKLNVNEASAAQLKKSLSLSEAEAAAVVRYRKENGRYKDLQGLKKVPGLDMTKIEANKDRIVF